LNIVAIIPARGGSKGVPRKNIKPLCGRPLISYIIDTALETKEIDRVIVSTEDPEIARVSAEYGAEIPFIRPEKLAKDETPTLPVLQHAVKYMEDTEGYSPDAVLLVYPTSPLLRSKRLSETIKIYKGGNYDSVISVTEDLSHYWIKRNNSFERFYPEIITNRQYAVPLYKENGAVYLTSRQVIMDECEVVGSNVSFLIMDDRESVDIDDFFDFELVEYMIKSGFKDN